MEIKTQSNTTPKQIRVSNKMLKDIKGSPDYYDNFAAWAKQAMLEKLSRERDKLICSP